MYRLYITIIISKYKQIRYNLAPTVQFRCYTVCLTKCLYGNNNNNNNNKSSATA